MVTCNKCGECCTFFIVELTDYNKLTKSEQLDLKKYYKYHECDVVESRGKHYLRVPRKCKMLLRNNTCKVHRNKPLTCKNFPVKSSNLDLLQHCIFKKAAAFENVSLSD